MVVVGVGKISPGEMGGKKDSPAIHLKWILSFNSWFLPLVLYSTAGVSVVPVMDGRLSAVKHNLSSISFHHFIRSQQRRPRLFYSLCFVCRTNGRVTPSPSTGRRARAFFRVHCPPEQGFLLNPISGDLLYGICDFYCADLLPRPFLRLSLRPSWLLRSRSRKESWRNWWVTSRRAIYLDYLHVSCSNWLLRRNVK